MSTQQALAEQVTLEVLEPKGVLFDPKREGLKNPRLNDLNGKTIALMSIHANGLQQFGSGLFFDELEVLLKKAYPAIRFYRCSSFGSPNQLENSAEIAAQCDAWVEGVKDAITQGKRDVGVYMERAGKPGVSICSDVVERSKRALADLNGMPMARVVAVPATDYCTAKRDQERMKLVVASAFDSIVKALTDPLTDSEKNVSDIKFNYSPKTFAGKSYTDAYEKFLQYCSDNALTDGLPVVPPTREAVEWMLTGTSYPRDKQIGLMYPKSGIATVEKIATCAVMAGARPEYLPVIITIVETITAKDFNQFHIVNEILPAIFISGPIIKELGINNKVGYLAPGHRINSTIGRALLLCMISIGWRDMTIYASPGGSGQPAAYANYLIAENQDENPWESWAVQNGFKPDESIITVCETISEQRGPAEVMSNADFEERLAQISKVFSRKSAMFGTFGMPMNAENVRHMIVLHPTMARQLANSGYTKQSFIKYLYDNNVLDWDMMSPERREELKTELAKDKIAELKQMFAISPEDIKPGFHREPFSSPEHVLVIVAGSGAGNVAIFQTPCGSTSDAEDVTETRPFMHKVIHGATLTKYGR